MYVIFIIGVGSINRFLHLAAAECAKADVLPAIDDKFISAAGRMNSKLRVVNSIIWLMEVRNVV